MNRRATDKRYNRVSLHRRAAAAVSTLAALATPLPAQLPYDTEYPSIPYATAEATDPVADLARRLAAGEATLERQGASAYLTSVLRELGIPVSSQMLVFSKTSLLARLIWPETPRAIYFSDRAYVAWTPGSDGLELSAQDPELGAVFYTLETAEGARPEIRRQTGLCLQCHDAYSLTGGGVPRHIMGSGPTDENGQLASHELWQVTNDTTAIEERWGGWYVTGEHGNQPHMGNVVIGAGGARLVGAERPADPPSGIRPGSDPESAADASPPPGSNVTDLSQLIDLTPYPGSHSDLVALLVAEHQITIQNLITLVSYRVRTAMHRDREAGQQPQDLSPRTSRLVESLGESLVRALLFVGTPRFEAPIAGTSTFASEFTAQGPRDTHGRSLREFDLRTRLFRYPLSYLIYSPEYDALPGPVHRYVGGRLLSILRGEESGADFDHLSRSDREAILSILRDTRPELSGEG